MLAQTALTGVQWVTFATYLLALGATLLYEAKRKTSFSAAPFVIYLCHGILFYLTLHIVFSVGRYNFDTFTIWSSVLRLHGAFTVLVVFAFEAYEQMRYARVMTRVKRRGLA
jgi:hypothetical protein